MNEKKEVNSDNLKEKNIINQVLTKLGKPKNLIKTNIFNVYLNRYRVNLIKNDGEIDSFFLHVSQEGEIIHEDPPIVRRY